MTDEPEHNDAEDVRSRFRAALERKRDQVARAVQADGAKTSKVRDARGRAGGKRTFRRKSG